MNTYLRRSCSITPCCFFLLLGSLYWCSVCLGPCIHHVAQFEGYDQQVASGSKGFPFRENKWSHRVFASVWTPFGRRRHREEKVYCSSVVTCFLHGPPPKWMVFFFSEWSNLGSPFVPTPWSSCRLSPAGKIQIQFVAPTAMTGLNFFGSTIMESRPPMRPGGLASLIEIELLVASHQPGDFRVT